EKMPEMDMQTEGQGSGQGQHANSSNKESDSDGQTQQSGQGSSGKPGKGGGSKAMANSLQKGEEAQGSSWAKQHKEYDSQKMQQLLNEAPSEYRDLVKQYYEALARTK
ncbi:MAG: hypothetical protein MK089_09630, partial [Phycisphaerales bacterium]|nr:hypothetical protein [Phycisphaerales bacterium]